MSRPSHIWILFGFSAVVLLAALGWVSLTVLRLDRVQAQAGQQAEFEEKGRLALWRMDSSLTPLIVEESARPASAYSSFHAAERPVTKGFSAIKQGDVLVPSPLLTYASSNILLHFQLSSAGTLTSPQVPVAGQREPAEINYTTRSRILSASASLGELQRLLDQPAVSAKSSAGKLARSPAETQLNREWLLAFCSATPGNGFETLNAPAPGLAGVSSQSPQVQMLRNTAEWNARANVYQQAQQAQQAAAIDLQIKPSGPSDEPFRPVWIGNTLLLARRVMLDNRPYVQGCWLNWANLRQSLLSGVKDLFPAADLQPVRSPDSDRQARLLATLPVKFVPGPLRIDPPPFWSPIRFSLLLAWGCVLLAALAVAALLHGAVSLSERRGAFVSAVTHELRTPLTTFKMYSEMLAAGMVSDEEKRQHYLHILCAEADRLGHLVENVLAYARLERGSARSRAELVTVRELIDRVRPRLLQRANQAGMSLFEDMEESALKTFVQVDVTAVEQILFNLVDNASKYAAPTATDKTIRLEAAPGARLLTIRVCDRGPGIPADGARRLFKPFSKSAHEAAHSAPGVGLGLALCRRLSRRLGGDLRYEPRVDGGACFALRLPIGHAAKPAAGDAAVG